MSTFPIGSSVTVRHLDGTYRVLSGPYRLTPISDHGVTLEADDGLRFWWSVADIATVHKSYT